MVAGYSFATDGFMCGAACRPVGRAHLPKVRFDLSDAGVVLCDGGSSAIARPLAEIAGWECARNLPLCDSSQDALLKSGDVVGRVSGLLGGGQCSTLLARFCKGGELDICSIGDILAFLVSDGEVHPLFDFSSWGHFGFLPGLGEAFAGSNAKGKLRSDRIFLESGDCLLVLTSGVWRNVSLSALSQACDLYGGHPAKCAELVASTADLLGARMDVAVAVIEKA